MLAHGGVIVKYTTTENENILKTKMHAVLAASLLANKSKKNSRAQSHSQVIVKKQKVGPWTLASVECIIPV